MMQGIHKRWSEFELQIKLHCFSGAHTSRFRGKVLVFVKGKNMLLKGFDFVMYIFIFSSQKSSGINVRRTSEDEWLLELNSWVELFLIFGLFNVRIPALTGRQRAMRRGMCKYCSRWLHKYRFCTYMNLLFAQIPHIRCQAQPPWDVFYACSTRIKPTDLSKLLIVIFTVLLCLFANLALHSCKKGH